MKLFLLYIFNNLYHLHHAHTYNVLLLHKYICLFSLHLFMGAHFKNWCFVEYCPSSQSWFILVVDLKSHCYYEYFWAPLNISFFFSFFHKTTFILAFLNLTLSSCEDCWLNLWQKTLARCHWNSHIHKGLVYMLPKRVYRTSWTEGSSLEIV